MTVYALNKKARFDYEVLETFEAGLVLNGGEVKSVRGGHMRLNDSYVTFHKNKPTLTNAHIPRYSYAKIDLPHEPVRPRELLLKSSEINYLRGKIEEKGLTIIPLEVYTKGRFIKLKIALVRGKKQFDKRLAIKKRDLDRETRRVLKG